VGVVNAHTAEKDAATRIEYASVLPGATEPDEFYTSLQEAVLDCAFGPCRVVQRTVTATPWVDVPRVIPPRYDRAR
jgi:hypothetical protein